MSKKFVGYNPLPEDTFDEDEPLEKEDDRDLDYIDIKYDEYQDEDGEIVRSFDAMQFCEWFGCNVLNPKVCTWCGIYWCYFTISEH